MSWISIYQQSNANDNAFNLRTVSLSEYTGQEIRIRFRYRFAGGSYYAGTGTDRGWIFDNISFSDVIQSEILGSETIAAGQHYALSTATTNTYWLRVQPLHHTTEWPAGNATPIQSFAPTSYDVWATVQEVHAGLPAGTLSTAPDADYSGDGIPNLIAYTMGIDPVEPAPASARPHLKQAADDIIYAYWTDHRVQDANIDLHFSKNLTDWFAVGDPLAPIAVIDEHVEYDVYREKRQLRFPRDAADKVFIRQRVALL